MDISNGHKAMDIRNRHKAMDIRNGHKVMDIRNRHKAMDRSNGLQRGHNVSGVPDNLLHFEGVPPNLWGINKVPVWYQYI